MPAKTTEKMAVEEFDLLGQLAALEKRADTFDHSEIELFADFCAKWMLNHLGTLDPRWMREIEAARIETRRSDYQLVGAWCARVLERGDHLNAPQHPYFVPGAASFRMTEKPCPECGKTFKAEYAGQQYCSNACGTAVFNRSRKVA